jgi:hypothetical protein
MINVPCVLPAIKRKNKKDCNDCVYNHTITDNSCFLFKNVSICIYKRVLPKGKIV